MWEVFSLLSSKTSAPKMKLNLEFVVPYQPECLGLVERMNSTVGYALTRSCYGYYSDWDKKIPKFLMGIRMRAFSRSGYSPFYLIYGIEARFPFEWEEEVKGSLEIRGYELKLLIADRKKNKRVSTPSTTAPKFEVVIETVAKVRSSVIQFRISPTWEFLGDLGTRRRQKLFSISFN
ncbi:Pro-Pol polyprotein [Smittium mucronatum]|uniref:Pro-Pol polyprotein n=1 Tax=Smittium mucronatum TaxID=133383 RepID=A0A1R0GPE7_9FUNG|nr:Pro-Pol polyprotein [Smittium mucronatum]